MTDDDQRQEAVRFETQARRDIQAARSLREFAPFQAYFMRRIVQRRDDLQTLFRYAPPAKVDPVEREIIRRILDELDTVINLTAEDTANARAAIERLEGR